MNSALHELFTRPLDRSGTWSSKWERYAGRDVLPFWVADMEFQAPPVVLDALRQRLEHGIFGYTKLPTTLVEAVQAFLQTRYRWLVPVDWLVFVPGVVPGLNLACRSVGAAGGDVLTATPIYYPFLDVPANCGRNRLDTPLIRHGSRWEMDFDHMDALLAAASAPQSFLFCNPQNPTGRVYSRTELEQVAELVLRHDLVLCSDEIHAELLLDPALEHVPIASLDADIARRTITLMAPTKTFNMPGLPCAFAIIPDPDLRRRFRAAGAGVMADITPLALTAAEAAYRDGEPWRQALLARLRANHERLLEVVNALPGLSMAPAEATCLGWIDARGLGLEDPHRYLEGHGLGLSPGQQFAGPGFVRFNFGCSPAMLEAGLERLQRAVAALND